MLKGKNNREQLKLGGNNHETGVRGMKLRTGKGVFSEGNTTTISGCSYYRGDNLLGAEYARRVCRRSFGGDGTSVTANGGEK